MSVRRNTLYNLLGSIIPLGVSLVTIPIYLGVIGEARYGVLAIAWLLLGYFGLFDLGLGRATAQRIAALRDALAQERSATFWTALALNVGLGVVGGLLIWPIATYFLGSVFQVDEALRPEVQAAAPWLILAVPMATLSGVLSGALQGRERFIELNLISVLGTILFQLMPLGTALLWGPDLGVLLPAALLARFLSLILMFDGCRRNLLRGQPMRFDSAQAGQLLRFGGWVTVTAFIGPMMVILDRFIIGTISGAKAVTYYTVPFQLAERSTIISRALCSAMFPRLASGTPQEEHRLALEAFHALVVVMTPLIAGGVLFVGPFLSWWITPDFAQKSALSGQIILLGFWANSLAIIPFVQLQARGRPDLVAKCHLAELLPYFCLLYFCMTTLGMVGAAIAFSVRVAVDFALLARLAGILQPAFLSLLMPSLILVSAIWVATYIIPGQLIWYLAVAFHLAITFFWAWRRVPKKFHNLIVIRINSFANYLKRNEIR